ncbi:hypothetical protein GALL_201280 [mine drainage metagenome]|uniref:Type IV pilus biogenesis protein PilP n=1 Tax=mine drainage metagenome TaxID=410659 RepID=A0A1J5S7N5_9ZZZZ
MHTRNSFALASAVLVACVLAPTVARAESCPSSLGTAQQVVCLQEQNAVLQQRLSNAQIAQALAKLQTGDGAPARNLGLPDVAAIFGRDGVLHAMLTWQDASGNEAGSLDVRSGAVLPGGLRVDKVEPGRVVLSDRHQTHVLLMSGGPGHGATSSSPSGGSGAALSTAIPPVPTLPDVPRLGGR